MGQNISFYKENITMKIEKEAFYVTGIYQVKTDTCQKGILLYPFPEDRKYGKVDSIYIYNLTTNQIIEPLKVESSHLIFKIDFSRHKDLKIHISYRQKLNSTRAEYILKTTQSWHKPLLSANYQLIVPSDVMVYQFSILPQDWIITETETIYYWEKSNYMPEENFIFDFIKK